jgi:hypothetical protein
VLDPWGLCQLAKRVVQCSRNAIGVVSFPVIARGVVVVWGLTLAVGVQGEAPWMMTSGRLPGWATRVKWSGSWGRTRA